MDGGWGWRREYNTTISCAQLDAYDSGPMMMMAWGLKLGALAKHSILLSEAQRQLFKGRPGPNLYLALGQDDLHYTSPSARVNLE